MALFARVKNWVSNEVLTASDLNAEFNNLITNATADKLIGYSANTSQMQLTADPGTVGGESLAGSAAEELTRLRFMLKFISGRSQWYDHTGRSLAANGLAVKNGDLDSSFLLPNANIAAAAITPDKVAAKTVYMSAASGSFTTTSTTAVDALTLAGVVATGRPLRIELIPNYSTAFSSARIGVTSVSAAAVQLGVKIVRVDSTSTATIIACIEPAASRTVTLSGSGQYTVPGDVTLNVTLGGADGISFPPGAFTMIDQPAAGTYTYKFQLYCGASGSQTASMNDCKLLVTEII